MKARNQGKDDQNQEQEFTDNTNNLKSNFKGYIKTYVSNYKVAILKLTIYIFSTC